MPDLIAARGAPASRSAGLALVVILSCQLMVTLDATIVNIALPSMQNALGFSPTNLSWVINAYTLTFGGLLLLGARSGDVFGRRRTLLAGLVLFTVGSLVGGLASNAGTMLTARAVQGGGAALASPSALALLMTTFPEGPRRVRAIALYTTMSIGGGAVGLLAGGMLTQWASWRWVMFVNVPIGLAAAIAGKIAIGETPRRLGRFDLAGAFSSTIGMTALVYGFVRVASDGWKDLPAIYSFVAGVLLLCFFVFVERRAAAPIAPLRLFADRNRVSSYVARICQFAGMTGVFFFLTQFLQDVQHYSPIRAGIAFVPLTLFLVISVTVSSRWIVGRIADQIVIAVGLLLCTGGMLWLTTISESSGYLDVFGPLVLFGVGIGAASVVLTNVSVSGVDPHEAGAASGLVNVMQQLGGALGLAVLITVYGSADADGFIPGARRGFLAGAMFLAVSAVIAAVVIRTKNVTETASSAADVTPDSPLIQPNVGPGTRKMGAPGA
ncbi:MFS transporter [Actinoplanes sp. NPDC051343]|uniref:MFS transporter n=1 Tax=Actinoplanes sp. NPDC051343 TaxID=3363906 RepID=UPI0037B35B2E